MSGVKGKSGIYKRTEEYLERLKKQGFQKGCIPWSKGKKLQERKSNAWKGGKIIKREYIFIYSPKHPFRSVDGYVLEHHLVIEAQIGRYLKKGEVGHHLGEKDDNRPKMLMAFVNNSAHLRFERGGKIKPSEIIFDGRKLR